MRFGVGDGNLIKKLPEPEALLPLLREKAAALREGAAAFRERWGALSGKQRGGVAAGAAIVCLVLFCLLFAPGHREERAASEGTKIYLQVRPGMTTREIGAQLEQHGVIGSSMKFWVTAKLNGLEGQIKTGNYALHPGMEPREVLSLLVEGKTTRVRFTIPEGFSVRDIAKRLADEGIVDEQEFLKKAEDYRPYDYIERHANTFYACEGFLFPDTYELGTDMDVDTILKEMSSDFDQRLTKKMRQRAAEEHLSLYELVTLASLVEKEARYEEDRPIIAQVFLKRLAIGMPLQSDTTLQYLRNDPKEDLSLEDTKVDSPYNTYQHEGLPPGPIASPGLAAIEAVLYPASTEYLYFVADRQGHNHYSTNYADHLALVEQVR